MKKISLAFLLALTAPVAACIPVHDYEGDYDMTYDVVLERAAAPDIARAGTAEVRVNDGLNSEYLLDLGADFCRLAGNYVEAEDIDEWPYLDIPPQACWYHSRAGATYELTLAGSASYTEGDDQRLMVVLSGSFLEAEQGTRGSATVQFTESW